MFYCRFIFVLVINNNCEHRTVKFNDRKINFLVLDKDVYDTKNRFKGNIVTNFKELSDLPMKRYANSIGTNEMMTISSFSFSLSPNTHTF